MSALTLVQQVAPSTPSANQVIVYPKSDKVLYWKDDTGTEHAVSDVAALVAQAASIPLPRSLAPNPFFQCDQRANNATSRANDVYASDRWYVLSQTAAIDVTAQTDQESGQPTNVRLSQGQAAAQRFGYASIIEGKFCKHLRGQTVTFRPRVRISASQAVRIAVLEWTGTEDVVTSDVVNSWTNGAYLAGSFFKATTTTISGVGAKTPAAATWTDMNALTVTLGTAFTNLILMIWVEQVAAQTVTLDIGKVRFTLGTYAGEIECPNYADEIRRCERYYQIYKPAAGYLMAEGASSTTAFAGLLFRTEMRVLPTFSVSAVSDFGLYNSGGSPVTVTGLVSAGPSTQSTRLDLTVASGMGSGFAALLVGITGNAAMKLDAEL